MSGEAWVAVIVVAVPFLLLVVYALADIVLRRSELAGIAKAAWVTAIVLLPALGVLAYYVMRPLRPSAGETEPSPGTSIADAVEDLRRKWTTGDLDDAALHAAKRHLFRV